MIKNQENKIDETLDSNSKKQNLIDNGEIDLSKDLEDIELALDDSLDNNNSDKNAAEKITTEINDNDIDELDMDLNLEDEMPLEENIKLEKNYDLDSDLELNNSNLTSIKNDSDFNGDELNLEIDDKDISLDDSEEFGVDLKSEPETIDSMVFEEDVIPLNKDDYNLKNDIDLGLNLENESIDFSKKEENLQALVENIESELDEDISPLSEKEDLISIPDEKENLELKDDFLEELPNISKEDLELNLEDSSELKPISNKDLLDNSLSSEEPLIEVDSKELDEIVTDESFLESLPEISDEELNLEDKENLEELTGEKNFSLDDLEKEISIGRPNNISEDNIQQEIGISGKEEEINLDGLEEEPIISEEELPEISSENIDVEQLKDTLPSFEEENIPDISPEELNVELTEHELESINMEGAEEIAGAEELDLTSLPNNEIKLENAIVEEKESNEKINPEEEDMSINLDNNELEELNPVEENIFPADENLPKLDEDINAIEIGDNENLPNSISPLKDANEVLSKDLSDLDLSGNLMDIDLDNIPEQKKDENNLGEESIGLSPDELEDVTKNAVLNNAFKEESVPDEEKIKSDEILEELEINEPAENNFKEESETIDLDTFEADLKEINIPEPDLKLEEIEKEDEYTQLKDEMKEKKADDSRIINTDVDSLKNNVKDVLSYLDQLLDALPEEKIKEFAESKAFEIYKKLFDELKIK